LSHTAERPFECDEIVNGESCGKTFKSKNKLQIHIKQAHGERMFVCEHVVDGFPPCGKSFPTEYRLKLHMKIHTESRSTEVIF